MLYCFKHLTVQSFFRVVMVIRW